MNNKESFIKKAIEIHGNKFDYSKVDYTNSHTKVCIICPIHGEFWQRPDKHLGKYGCRLCANKGVGLDLTTSIKDVKNKLWLLYGEEYDYDFENYENLNSEIKIKSIYGERCVKVSNLLTGNFDFHKHTGNHGKKKYSTKEFVEKAIKVHGDLYDYSQVRYVRSNEKVAIICPKHGVFHQTPSAHLRGCKCLKCAREENGESLSLTTEEFIEKSNDIHKNLYDYSLVDYKNRDDKVKIICKKHGIFEQAPRSHLAGYGCPKCMLKSQTRIYNRLSSLYDSLMFEYSTEWIFPQRFDMYLEKYNIAIEYNGRQHYMPIKKFGGELGFQKCQQRDKLKREKCLQNDCKLFEIRYDHEEEDLQHIINEINKIIENYET